MYILSHLLCVPRYPEEVIALLNVSMPLSIIRCNITCQSSVQYKYLAS